MRYYKVGINDAILAKSWSSLHDVFIAVEHYRAGIARRLIEGVQTIGVAGQVNAPFYGAQSLHTALPEVAQALCHTRGQYTAIWSAGRRGRIQKSPISGMVTYAQTLNNAAHLHI